MINPHERIEKESECIRGVDFTPTLPDYLHDQGHEGRVASHQPERDQRGRLEAIERDGEQVVDSAEPEGEEGDLVDLGCK